MSRSPRRDEPVAIIGMACLLPGAHSPEEFWTGLLAGADHRTEGGRDVFGTGPDVPGGWGDPDHRVTAVRGGFVTEPPIPLDGLRLPAERLASLDRVVRWSLHTARRALVDAGLDARPDALARTGLVLGNYAFPTEQSVRLCTPPVRQAVTEGLSRAGLPLPADAPGADEEPAPENLWPFGGPAVTTADALGLGGPRLALDAACSSALYGISLARDYLATGRADTMVAGAVCAPDPLLIHLSFSDLRAYPDNGVSQPFDGRSTGIVTGQGAGAFVLKRLADALRDGDRVYAVLESVGLSNDGAGRHLLSPNQAGQLAAYRQAYAGIDPVTVDYIECHATGTPLGDATELRGLTAFFAEHGTVPPLLGSVKGNVGHLLTVAGFTSLLKAVLALRHGTVPATPGVAEPLRPAGGEAAAERIVRERRPWPEGKGPRRAAVSAFGFGGTNAHLVLSGPEAAASVPVPAPSEKPARAPEPPPLPRLAVTGLGTRLGPLAGTGALHRAARLGRTALTGRPPHRWYGADATARGPLAGTPAEGSAAHGGYLDRIDVHPRTYRIPPNELAQANPQHLALFEAAEQALADAGYPAPPPGAKADELPERRVGVVIAMEMEPRTHTHRARFDIGAHVRAECERAGVHLGREELDRLEEAVRGAVHEPIGANEVLSYIGNIMASRLSSSRNLTGPSFTVAADGTAAVRALEVAGLLLLDPAVEAVLVGGVDLAAGAENTRARARQAARDGEELPPLGDGAVAVVVTRAGEDTGRRAYATVDALHVRSATAGRDAAVAEAARAALADAGAAPGDIEYLELGGSTPAARRAEAAALASVYRHAPEADAAGDTGADDPYGCVLGSTGALVGDTQRAAPLAALATAVLALHHADFPAAPDGLLPDPQDAAFEGSRFTVLGDPQPWPVRRRGAARAAALSLLGDHGPAGATAAHLVLRGVPQGAAPARPAADWRGGPGVLLLPLTADDGPGLAAAARAAATALAERGPEAVTYEAARELTARRARHTAVLVAADADRLVGELAAAERDLPRVIAEGGEWSTPSGSYCTARPTGPGGKVAFVYPGAFTTYPGAGRDLFRLFPVLLDGFEREADHPARRLKHRALHPRARGPLGRRELMRHEEGLIDDIPVMLAAGTNFAVLHTRLLRDVLGIRPHGGFGYSLGESSMLFASGVWAESARDDTALAATPLFRDRLRGPKLRVRDAWGIPASVPDGEVWATRVLLAGPDAVREAMAGQERVFLTHVNTPREVVIAGDPKQVAHVIAKVGCQAAKAPANHVMHCPVVDPELDALAALNDYPLGDPAPDLELLSAYDYDRVDLADRERIARRIAVTLRSTIDFARLAETAHERGYRYFVEVGPGATCTRWIGETLKGRDHVAVSVDRRGAPVAAALAQALARLVAHGLPVDLGVLMTEPSAPGRTGPVLSVPCGGESIADRTARAAAAVLTPDPPEVLPDDSARPSTPPSATPETQPSEVTPAMPPVPPARPAPVIPAPDPASERIVIEEEPFVHLPEPLPRPAAGRYRPAALARPAAPPLRALAATVAQAHRSALRAQAALTENALRALEAGAPPAAPPVAPAASATREGQVLWGEEDLLEFARGRVAPVFGPAFAEVDTYPRRCRLPEPPYLFVSRVTRLVGETGRFEPSEITTEYDVPVGAWYTVDGLVPCAVTIEAGQCDMLLIAYLGIDFRTRGERVYRLLDSRLVFHGGLPREGQTLRYDIRIDRFVWNGDNLLFFFNYRCYADGELILELLDACAGFFTPAELADSLGVVETAADRRRRAGMGPARFKPLARTDRTSLTGTDLELLAAGRPGEVFGPRWDQSADGCNPSVRLPDERLRMIDEIPVVDRLGGPRGLGALTAVKRLDPDGWYFRCHFTGDPVLAGSLIAEGGVQLLQVYAVYLGMHMVFPDAEFQAVPGLQTEVKVRGQITPETREVRYEVEIIELTMLPRPTVVADITVYDGDKPIVAMRNFGVRVQEKPGTPYRPEAGGIPAFLGRRNERGEAAFINELHLAHAAKGDLATAMGREFEIYAGRRAPYIPNGDFRFVDRIMRLGGTRGELSPGATMATEYDSPPEAWYYRDTAGPEMPNCVVMETSLQAAILLGYYLGATLQSPEEELAIRNLDGRARFVRRPELGGKTIRHESELLSSQSVPGATLQNFRYRLLADDEVFYEGESLFGYFTDRALAHQVGLDSGAYVPPWLETERAGLGPDRMRTLAVRADDRWFTPRPGTGLRLAGDHLRMVDEVTVVDGGGTHGRGYLFGRRTVADDDWYFDCHFHRDPVMPGSLGVEAVIQALQVYVIESGLADGMGPVRFGVPLDVAMAWKYRGQILRGDGEMTFETHIKEVRRDGGRLVVVADASVWKPNLRIYELTDVAVEVLPVPADEAEKETAA